MSAIGTARWRTVAALSAALLAGTTLVTLSVEVAMDHVWSLLALVVAAAVVRALGAGNPRSILGLAATMLIAQPALHYLGEITATNELANHHDGQTSTLLVAAHLVLIVAVTAMIRAGEDAGHVVALGVRRLVRVLVQPVPSTSPYPAVDSPAEPPPMSYKKRQHVPQPSRRGPPVGLCSFGP
ncbi:hypothetical protein [Actinomycetospora atypica]|uniref:Uncharacterized protein n=1 Tax=Actinomycetospora atypica TaxID=1290095 RepID=A0ABV9YPM9_9PSEU